MLVINQQITERMGSLQDHDVPSEGNKQGGRHFRGGLSVEVTFSLKT